LTATLIVLGLFFGLVNHACAQSDGDAAVPVALPAYAAAIADARDTLADASDPAAVDAARQALAQISQVRLPNGALIEVTPLLGPADQPLTRAEAQARLNVALHQLEAAASDDAAARLAVLASVLAGPEFSHGESLWDRFRRWLDELWNRLSPPRSTDPATAATTSAIGTRIGWALAIAGAAALLWLLAYWLRGFLGSFVANAEANRPVDGGDGSPQTPAAARQRASLLARAGNYREAVRNLYLSTLLTLEEHGLVTPDRSLTNRELLDHLDVGHPLRPHLQPVVDTFDAVWYGVQNPDDQTYRAYADSIDELETLARQQEKA